MTRSVIVSSARTPIGKFQGGFAGLSAMELGGVAIRAALERADISGPDVDYVIMGHVLQAGQGQITARQAATKGGIPMDIPAITVNKVCLSGINAIAQADYMIRLGEAQTIVAGGMESMTRAPYLLADARSGYRMGDGKIIDCMIRDGLWCAFDDQAMGDAADRYNTRYQITRQEQDEWAARSHERAADATKNGVLGEEITRVEIPQRKGDPLVVLEDEGIRPGTTTESLAGLRPAFASDGTITAGNASQISDGAAAVVVMSEERARTLGLEPEATVISHGQVAGPDPSLHEQPSSAIRAALAKTDLALKDVSLFEINEAFAAVAVAATRALEVSDDIVNVNGGAVALGHPIGASGCRITLTLARELARRGGGIGAAGICGGGGQGDALILRV
jgi:acetyl-CoA C-acetyltransferase